MSDTLDPRFLDRRTAERYIHLGLLDEKAYERHLKSLPDLADKAAPIETSMFDDEDEELESEEGSGESA